MRPNTKNAKNCVHGYDCMWTCFTNCLIVLKTILCYDKDKFQLWFLWNLNEINVQSIF